MKQIIGTVVLFFIGFGMGKLGHAAYHWYKQPTLEDCMNKVLTTFSGLDEIPYAVSEVYHVCKEYKNDGDRIIKEISDGFNSK